MPFVSYHKKKLLSGTAQQVFEWGEGQGGGGGCKLDEFFFGRGEAWEFLSNFSKVTENAS